MAKKKTQRELNQKIKEIKRPIGKDKNGKTIRKSFYGPTKAAAEQDWKDFLVALKLGDVSLPKPKPKRSSTKVNSSFPPDIVFEAWAWRWFEIYIECSGVSQDTIDNTYLTTLRNQLIPHFGEIEMRNIKDIDVTLFLQSISNKSESLVNKANFILAAILNKALKNGVISSDPFEDVKKVTGKKAAEKQAYTPEQEKIHLEFCKTHQYGLIAALPLKTSCSRSEAAALTVESFDMRNQIINLDGGIQRNGKRGNGKNQYRPRKNPYDNELAELLKKFELPESGYIFQLADGRSIGQYGINYRYNIFLDDMLLEHPEMPRLTYHPLRGTCSTRLMERGVSKEVIARFMGHAINSKITDLYIHYNMDYLISVIRPKEKKKAISVVVQNKLPSRVRVRLRK